MTAFSSWEAITSAAAAVAIPCPLYPGVTKPDGMFGFHPALAETDRMYGGGEVIGFHVVASVYHERSHFAGQNVLETGGSRPYALKDGWMLRPFSRTAEGRHLSEDSCGPPDKERVSILVHAG